MKNLIKIGLLACVFPLTLLSCDFLGKKAESASIDTNKIDSSAVDALKVDSTAIDSVHLAVDSVKKQASKK